VSVFLPLVADVGIMFGAAVRRDTYIVQWPGLALTGQLTLYKQTETTFSQSNVHSLSSLTHRSLCRPRRYHIRHEFNYCLCDGIATDFSSYCHRL